MGMTPIQARLLTHLQREPDAAFRTAITMLLKNGHDHEPEHMTELDRLMQAAALNDFQELVYLISHLSTARTNDERAAAVLAYLRAMRSTSLTEGWLFREAEMQRQMQTEEVGTP